MAVTSGKRLSRSPAENKCYRLLQFCAKYIADLDDPLARKMEAMLSKFGCETHREEAIAMADTVSIDYFARM
jgi:hypothetical protein